VPDSLGGTEGESVAARAAYASPTVLLGVAGAETDVSADGAGDAGETVAAGVSITASVIVSPATSRVAAVCRRRCGRLVAAPVTVRAPFHVERVSTTLLLAALA
jgi:hypothetical protein